MTLRKPAVDNSVKYIPNCEQIQSIAKGRDSKPNTKMNISLSRKQNKNISQILLEKFIKNIAAEGFRILEWLGNCYFWLKTYRYVDWTDKNKTPRNAWI